MRVTEALSGASGSISLAAWIFVLVPQFIENYKTGSANGISLTFLLVWMIGDIANLLGAIWAGLVPTVIALAIYFCFADTVLILQCLYYRRLKGKTKSIQYGGPSQDDPNLPLLGHEPVNIGLPGSRRNSSPSRNHRESVLEGSLLSIPEDNDVRGGRLQNSLCVCAICLVGITGWAIAWQIGAWRPVDVDANDDESTRREPLGALALGYVSAICYLGARVPQMVKNFRDKSCEGLSLLFFVLSLLGNLTYGGGIIFHSVAAPYLLTNLPWLIGSLGTMGEDVLIFVQFCRYSKEE